MYTFFLRADIQKMVFKFYTVFQVNNEIIQLLKQDFFRPISFLFLDFLFSCFSHIFIQKVAFCYYLLQTHCCVLDLDVNTRSTFQWIPSSLFCFVFVYYSHNCVSSCRIAAPSGDRVHADVYPVGNGEFRVEWVPRMAGMLGCTHWASN